MQPCLDHFNIEESGVAETPAKVLPVTLFLFALGWIGAAHLVGWPGWMKQDGEEHFYGQ